MAGAVNFFESDLSVADMEDFEEATGVKLLDALQAIDAGEQEDTKVLTGLIWIAARRDTPGLSFEDARHLPISTLSVKGNRETRRAARPTKAAPKKSGSKKTTSAKKPGSRR